MDNKNKVLKRIGFTLIEILVVVGMISILAAIVLVAINPARQFAQGRNTQRMANVNAILNAIGQNIADNKGIFTCSAGPLPTAAKNISENIGDYNLRPCIVPAYISEIPVDPSAGINDCDDDCSTGSYDTKYQVEINANGRVKICAPNGAESALAGSAAICVTR
jgi:prepilin-type N-terminal cleavage/methylation domain-containing protein